MSTQSAHGEFPPEGELESTSVYGALRSLIVDRYPIRTVGVDVEGEHGQVLVGHGPQNGVGFAARGAGYGMMG
jgi:hypothetical protein